jgi:hypothetical protein
MAEGRKMTTSTFMLGIAEACMSPRVFNEHWCLPFKDEWGVWRSNPPGYSVGFVISSEKIGVERGRKSIYSSYLKQPHPIWC